MNDNTAPAEWPAKGEKVAVVTWYGGAACVRLDTVERLTATQIILSDSSKFRTKNHREVGTGNAELHRTNDPIVISSLTEAHVRALRHELDKLLGAGAKHPDAALALLADATGLIDRRRAGLITLLTASRQES